MPRRAPAPRPVQVGDQLYQKYNPWNSGTVSEVVKGHSFTVVYHDPSRRRGQPRQRFTYPFASLRFFLLGNPPAVEAPAVNVEVDDA